ncbi:hypothetical protein C8F01DRAFT_5538 [Mycena amicta]|nr:hypothetical protein C8F01DRAFT_5538 [Mycena amicta]
MSANALACPVCILRFSIIYGSLLAARYPGCYLSTNLNVASQGVPGRMLNDMNSEFHTESCACLFVSTQIR